MGGYISIIQPKQVTPTSMIQEISPDKTRQLSEQLAEAFDTQTRRLKREIVNHKAEEALKKTWIGCEVDRWSYIDAESSGPIEISSIDELFTLLCYMRPYFKNLQVIGKDSHQIYIGGQNTGHLKREQDLLKSYLSPSIQFVQKRN